MTVIEEREEVESLEMSVPIPFRNRHDAASFIDIMKTCCPERFIGGKFVYHYTRSDVFEKLMADNGDILCSRYTDLNDDGEWQLGVEYISEYISGHFIPEISDSFKELVQDIQVRNPPFIASFSAHMDKASLWGMYTDRKVGGYALGVGISDIERRCKRNNELNKTYELLFLPCVYIGVDNVDSIIARILDNHSDEIEYTARHTIFEVGELLARRLLFLSYLIKHDSFDYENEWRLVLNPLDSKIVEKVVKLKENDDGKRIFSRLFGENDPIRNSFRQVEVSPHGNRTELYRLANMYRDRYNLSFGLSFSESTYNGR